MPINKRRIHSEEFRREAVRRAEEGDAPFAHVARELGINTSLLNLWRRKYLRDDAPAKPAATESQLEELHRLRRENAALREDREILKKAAAFFAKESR
jgi:transposase